MKFLIKFKNFNQLICNIDDSDVGARYYSLVKSNYQQSFPVYRDRPKFTRQYLSSLAEQANNHFRWNWDVNELTLENTTQLHKDIEQLLVDGFDSIPADLDHVIHDLHYGLHILQDNVTPSRIGWMQIEWYNDSGFALEDYKFKSKLDIGDLRLQNPYVGHGPLQVYTEKDFTNISQTCKFHDVAKPGINLITVSTDKFNEEDQLIEKFQQHDPKFVDQHGIEKIKSYIGFPVVGKVENIDLLEQIISYDSILELESIKFD
jgi:hypothetical protein|tara:strand:- start:108 stop:890 length:783 start_codon:yes stop_codon:yes gene_type:complete